MTFLETKAILVRVVLLDCVDIQTCGACRILSLQCSSSSRAVCTEFIPRLSRALCLIIHVAFS